MDVELLKSQLLHRKITIGRFRLPYSYEQTKDMLLAAYQAEVEYEQTKDMLLAAYQAEVEYRCRHFTTCEEFESQREQIARFLTRNSEKFGLFFSGMCGNGKTTWLKAIRTLINSLNLRHPQTNSSYSVRTLINSLNLRHPQTNSSYSVSLWNARELAYRCKDEYQEWARIARLPILAIDDFGTDPKEIISFGNCLTPMIDLITKGMRNSCSPFLRQISHFHRLRKNMRNVSPTGLLKWSCPSGLATVHTGADIFSKQVKT